MEKRKKFEKMNIEKTLNKSKLKNNKSDNITQMDIENENKISESDEFNSESLVELNSSTSTYNSIKSLNNSLNSMDKSIKKKDEPEIIFNIVKENKNKKTYNFQDDYFDEIYSNLLLDEKNGNIKIKSSYMNNQNEINDQMRAILVDWLIEVHYRFRFKRKTLFQTIYIIDLYLSYNIIYKKDLQLLGVVSLLISAKENEVVYPTIEDFISITDNAYNKSELLYMEIHVLQSLNFDILFPTPDEFYNILSKIFNFNKLQHHFGEYFLDSALIDYNMLKYKYSTISIACIYIVMKFFNLNGYKDLYSSKFILGDTTEKLIKECSKYLCFLVKNLSKSYLKATKEKYSSKEFDNVEAICEEK